MGTQMTMTNAMGGIVEGNFEGCNLTIDCDKVLDFAGTNDYIAVSSSADFGFGAVSGTDGDFTVTAWIKPNLSATTNFGNVYSDDSMDLKIEDTGELRIYTDTGDSTTAQVPTNVWSFVTWGRSGANFFAGINGATETLTPGAKTVATSGVQIGQKKRSTSELFAGKIADVRVYDIALSSADLGKLASAINQDNELGSGHANLQGWWKLNEGTGTSATDYSSNSHTGTLTNFPTTAWGVNSEAIVDFQDNSTTMETLTVKSGTANVKALNYIDLVPASDYVTISNADHLEFGDAPSADADTPFAVSAWVNLDAKESFDILQKHHEWRFGTDGSGYLYLRLEDGGDSVHETATYAVALTENRWVHLAAVYSGVGGTSANAGISLYVDGIPVTATLSDSGSYAGMHDDMNGDIYIGRQYGVTVTTNGKIRDVRIYTSDLAPEKIKSLYWGTFPVKPTHWWKCDDDSGATGTVADSGSGTTSNGTGTSLTWVTGTLDVKGGFRVGTNGTVT